MLTKLLSRLSLRSLIAASALALVSIGTLVPSAGCASKTATSSDRLCTPGTYVFCRCKDRAEGTKLCSEDARSFGPCDPCTASNPELPSEGEPPATELPATTDGDSGTPPTTSARCGDGIVQEGEDCDDKNALDDDGCDSSCRLHGTNPVASRSCPGMDVHVWGTRPVTYVGTTFGAPANAGATPPCPSAEGNNPTSGAAAPNRMFHVIAHRTGQMTVATSDAEFDNWLYVSAGCRELPEGASTSQDYNAYLTCSNKSDQTDGESIRFPVEAGKAYTVFVDGVLTSKGPFRVTFAID